MRLLTLRTVVAATDLTSASDPALETAARLVEAGGATLHVVHVASDLNVAAEKERRSALVQEVETAMMRAGLATGVHRIHILSGDPPAVIAKMADRLHADLEVLGRHRERARSSHGELGSTAYDVIIHSASPCLVLRRSLVMPIRRVLVATDFSESARGALLMALSWTSALRSRSAGVEEPVLWALHVDSSARADQRARETLDHELALLRRSAGGWAGVNVQGVTQPGADPVSGIVDYATKHEVDLVVLGTRGLTVGGNTNLGSVAAAATRQLDIPVLLVPPAIWRNFAKDLGAA